MQLECFQNEYILLDYKIIMEFSESIAQLIFELEYQTGAHSADFQKLFENFENDFSDLISYYQKKINFTLGDDHIRAIVYVYHIFNFLKYFEKVSSLVLPTISVSSICEKFLKNKKIKIEPNQQNLDELKLNSSVLILEFSKDFEEMTYMVK